jgi:1,4-alpha-glucan branching enzyme
MGNEIGQVNEWNHDSSVNWHLLEFDKHKGIQAVYRDLNKLYKTYPALHESDHNAEGFEWIDHGNAEQSILSMLRKSSGHKQKIYVINNFTPVVHKNYRMGVQDPGKYQIILNTDDKKYWGSAYSKRKTMSSEELQWNNQNLSITFDLPPLASLYILYKG